MSLHAFLVENSSRYLNNLREQVYAEKCHGYVLWQ